MGFPGWHLECSAMSMKYLGQTIDIHAGGIDHLPVHHTNEIAQSQSATGQPFANYWMHANHVTVYGEKISKSLGNGITLEDIENKGFTLEAFRLHVLESHYRSQSKFSWESLEASANRLKNWHAFADLQFQTTPQAPPRAHNLCHETQSNMQASMENDLDTPEALRIISETIDAIIQPFHPRAAEAFVSLLRYLDTVFGTALLTRSDITPAQKQQINKREQARSEKGWAEADKLRAQLKEQGVGLRDTPAGAVWYRL
jgi:cysteinyl-tRNA synthetase